MRNEKREAYLISDEPIEFVPDVNGGSIDGMIEAKVLVKGQGSARFCDWLILNPANLLESQTELRIPGGKKFPAYGPSTHFGSYSNSSEYGGSPATGRYFLKLTFKMTWLSPVTVKFPVAVP